MPHVVSDGVVCLFVKYVLQVFDVILRKKGREIKNKPNYVFPY